MYGDAQHVPSCRLPGSCPGRRWAGLPPLSPPAVARPAACPMAEEGKVFLNHCIEPGPELQVGYNGVGNEHRHLILRGRSGGCMGRSIFQACIRGATRTMWSIVIFRWWVVWSLCVSGGGGGLPFWTLCAGRSSSSYEWGSWWSN